MTAQSISSHNQISGNWFAPAVIQPNNFIYKSLSSWSFNTAVGCSHACRFCYVPSAATIKQTPQLKKYGVEDPDLEWGNYVLIRPWDESKFLASLKAAENTPISALNPDGNRAVMLCTTTDPYQVIRNPDPRKQAELSSLARFVVRRALELIRDYSSLNVRILTRSPMARVDFDLYKTFGNRLVFGMSLPTLQNKIAKVYEPHASAPSRRFETLMLAKKRGLHVYVAMAPTYPECDASDLRSTLEEIAKLEPITVFHEPINIRAENVTRIESEALENGLSVDTAVFSTRESWRRYAIQALCQVWEISKEVGLRDRIHLWPDKALGSREAIQSTKDPIKYEAWLRDRWSRVSEWPTNHEALVVG